MSNETTGAGKAAAQTAWEPPQYDFPTWLPPMLVKELRQGLRTKGFVGGLIAVQAVLALVFIFSFATETVTNGGKGPTEIFFWLITGCVLLVAAPVRALSALGPEIEQRTMDLLLLTRLDARMIVWGKWVSLQAQTLLLLATLLPYLVVRYFFGSVDLVNDFAVMAGMLVGGSVLSALGLWASGLPRALRLLIVVAMVFILPSVFGAGFARSFGGATGSGGGWDGLLLWSLGLWNAAVGLLYMLVLAVRWFAPPAENHAALPRLVPLALALPAVFLVSTGRMDLAVAQLAIVSGGLVFVAAVELVTVREPMAIHLRGFMARGGWRCALGLLALPGWPSAALWLAVNLGIAGAGWAIVGAVLGPDAQTARVLGCLALGWAGMVFPIVLVSLIPSAAKTAGPLYFLVHVLLGAVVVIAGIEPLSVVVPGFMQMLDWISHAVPTASFWHAALEFKKPSTLPGVIIGQTAGLLLTAGLTYWVSRPYWERVRWLREASKPKA